MREVCLKRLTLHDSKSVTFWKRKNCGDCERVRGCQGLGMEGQNTGASGAVSPLCVLPL